MDNSSGDGGKETPGGQLPGSNILKGHTIKGSLVDNGSDTNFF